MNEKVGGKGKEGYRHGAGDGGEESVVKFYVEEPIYKKGFPSLG